MRSNVNNQFGTAPDGGHFNGPVLGPISKEDLAKIKFELPNSLAVAQAQNASSNSSSPRNGTLPRSSSLSSQPKLKTSSVSMHSPSTPAAASTAPVQGPQTQEDFHAHGKRDAGGDWWLGGVKHGGMPMAPSNYSFFRNVKDYGAVGDGVTDDTAAINKAASDGNRCGSSCGSSTTLGALVYFPPGRYLVSSPIIQYYYTQFVGDAINPPTLQSTYNFTGIAIIDSDVYIPGASGAEWYLNQNNFYRQVRNFNFDLTFQAASNTQNYQQYVPTGIHWQGEQSHRIARSHSCKVLIVSSCSWPRHKHHQLLLQHVPLHG